MAKTLQISMAVPALMVAAALAVPAFAQEAQIQTGATATSQAPAENPTAKAPKANPHTPAPKVNSGIQSENIPANAQPADNETVGYENSENGTAFASEPPLTVQSHEGFWGHLNPFARKKWLRKQLDPVKGRLNELDQLQAKNAQDIKNVDRNAQAGIHQAEATANQANETATNANNTATQANQLAGQANSHITQLDNAVANIDQYHAVDGTLFRFRPGQTMLNHRAKNALTQMTGQLQGQNSYLVEVTGYSDMRGEAGMRRSKLMATAVSRYLAEHQIPIYRIHQVAMGHSPMRNGEYVRRGSAVQVTILQNSLAALNTPSAEGGSPIGATQQSSAQPSPQGAASQPTE